ncbi:unnamed protein product [Adineta steineri]|uniref:Uncharacterized protein n=1 Tax=Adineta steineri TaxID=433720 RepID=A0A815KFK6_9BILA|nr:unnamed protein product [Adineta steineri]CAF1395298.1 unnamed protein product [Adineta steineri]
MKETIAGDCNGRQCGCYNDYCWSYVKERRNNDGISWCYTQNIDSTSAQHEWQRCRNDHDCDTNRPCVNFVRPKTSEKKSQNDIHGWGFGDLFEWW